MQNAIKGKIFTRNTYKLKWSRYPNHKSKLVNRGWSGGPMVLGKLPKPERLTIWMIVGLGPTALAVGAGSDCLDIFTLLYLFSPLGRRPDID